MTRTETAPLVYRGASKNYRQHFWSKPSCSLDALDLQVREGEILGLLGHNGAGKTTSIEIFEGLNQADEGDVEVIGRRWGQGHDRALRERLGIQLQETQFSEKLTVAETLAIELDCPLRVGSRLFRRQVLLARVE